MPDTNWPEVVKTVSSAASVPLLAWFLGRRAVEAKEKLDLRSADQKSIEHLAGRVDKLEARVDTLTGEKVALQVQIIEFQRRIAELEIEKREAVSRDAVSTNQINSLNEMLVATREELRCAKEKLAELEGAK